MKPYQIGPYDRSSDGRIGGLRESIVAYDREEAVSPWNPQRRTSAPSVIPGGMTTATASAVNDHVRPESPTRISPSDHLPEMSWGPMA